MRLPAPLMILQIYEMDGEWFIKAICIRNDISGIKEYGSPKENKTGCN